MEVKNQIAHILKSAYLRKKAENRRFSMQVLANKLEISLPFLSQVLSGKRALPPELANPMCDILDLDNEKRDWITRGLLQSRKLKGSTGLLAKLRQESALSLGKAEEWTIQPKSNFWILHEWFHLAILDATLLKDFDGSIGFLAQRLGLPTSVIENSVKKMLDADILVKTSDGKIRKKHKLNDFHSQSSKTDIRAYHAVAMEKAKETLRTKTLEEDVEQRLITTYTMTVPRDKVSWAKQQIAEFIKSIAAELSTDRPEEVYQLGIQFFPLTHPEKPKESK